MEARFWFRISEGISFVVDCPHIDGLCHCHLNFWIFQTSRQQRNIAHASQELLLVFNSHLAIQVSHQLWLVWHLGLDPWHRRQIWQIHHAQVIWASVCVWRMRVTSHHLTLTVKPIFLTTHLFQTEAFPVDVWQGRTGALSRGVFQAGVNLWNMIININIDIIQTSVSSKSKLKYD